MATKQIAGLPVVTRGGLVCLDTNSPARKYDYSKCVAAGDMVEIKIGKNFYLRKLVGAIFDFGTGRVKVMVQRPSDYPAGVDCNTTFDPKVAINTVTLPLQANITHHIRPVDHVKNQAIAAAEKDLADANAAAAVAKKAADDAAAALNKLVK